MNAPISATTLAEVETQSRNSRRYRTVAQLQKKRARDRESQRACRSRNRERVLQLESEVSALQARCKVLLRQQSIPIAFSTSTSSHAMPSCDNNGVLDVSRLVPDSMAFLVPSVTTETTSPECEEPCPCAAEDSLFASREIHHDTSEIKDSTVEPRDAANILRYTGDLDLDPSPPSVLHHQSRKQVPCAGTTSISILSTVFTSLDYSSNCMCAMYHSRGSECLDHGIFRALFDAHTAIAADLKAARPYPRSPSVANLLLLDVESNPIVSAISIVIRNVRPLELPEAMACYFIIYRLLRWRVNPIPETYYDIPKYFRPSALQRARPHPVCIDLIAWPKLRDFLVTDIDSVDAPVLGRDISECMTIAWPKDQELFIRDVRTGETILNPRFEEHVWYASNWKMRRSWIWKQPRLAHLVNISDRN